MLGSSTPVMKGRGQELRSSWGICPSSKEYRKEVLWFLPGGSLLTWPAGSSLQSASEMAACTLSPRAAP